MDVCQVIKSRLEELGLEQKDLAAAAEVTESYVSQLLSPKETAARAESNGHLRKDGRLAKAFDR